MRTERRTASRVADRNKVVMNVNFTRIGQASVVIVRGE